MSKPKSEEWFGLFTALAISALIGCLVFFLAAPASILKPTNIAWLHAGDFSANYLGWLSYRDAPLTIPPWGNSHYGLELANSIFFADALPVIALPAKWLNPFLVRPFQYFGPWLLACFILQAFFSFRLTQRFSLPPAAGIGFTALACLFPPLLFRMTLHLALSGHWLILAGFSEYFRERDHKFWRWPALCGIASMVHAYLLVMVLALWLATRARDGFAGRFGAARWLVETTAVLAAVTLGLWLSGFFLVDSGYGRFGYGHFQMNLLAPIDPGRFSAFLPDLPSLAGDYEGYSYFGMGALLVLAVGGVVGLKRSLLREHIRHWPLLLVVGLMLAYAVSNNLALADYQVELFRFPEFLAPLTSSLRSSGRFAWPALYMALLASYVFMWRQLGIRIGGILTCLVVTLQVLDLSPALAHTRILFSDSGSRWDSPLVSQFWRQVAARNLLIRRIPVENHPTAWDVFASYALDNGLRTDSVYLARMDEHVLAASQRRAEIAVTSGGFAADAVYVVDVPTARSVKARRLDGFALVAVDGFLVVAPSDLADPRGSDDVTPPSADDLWLQIELGDRLQIAAGGQGSELLGLGWRPVSQQGTHARGSVSELVFLLRPSNSLLRFRLDGRCLGRAPNGVTVTVNGVPAPLIPSNLSAGSLSFQVPGTRLRPPPEPNIVQLHWSQPIPDPWTFTSVDACQVPQLQEISLQADPTGPAE